MGKLETALDGNVDAFEHVLDLAYGRKGKLRWEIIKVCWQSFVIPTFHFLNIFLRQPLLKDPNAPPAPRIVSAHEKSRPPTYSPELAALLTSTHSRTTKALDKGNLKSPPILPTRVDPSSEDAGLLGPFSKRREVNMRWRYFRTEYSKVLPPLQLSVKEITESFQIKNESSEKHSVASIGIRGVGLQGTGLLERAQELAGPAWKPLQTPHRTSRERESQYLKESDEGAFQSNLPTRWLRKRYQGLLGKVPILTYTDKNQGGNNKGCSPAGRYEVTLAPSAISSHIRYGANRLPPVDDSSLAWITRAQNEESNKRSV